MTASGLLEAPQITQIEPVTQLDDLRPGLLLFFARPSPLQTWAELFGHEWRHVGITVQTERGLMVASYGPRKCFRLDDPYEIMGAYTRVGVAQLFTSDAEVERVEAYCRRFEHFERSDSPYTFSGILVGPIHLLARRRRPGIVRRLLLWFVILYCWMQKLRYHDRTAFGCSTFAWAVVSDVLERPLRLPLRAHPDDDAAYATPSNPTDELLARWLCGPTELWQAISPLCRSDLDLSQIDGSQSPETRVAATPVEEVALWPAPQSGSGRRLGQRVMVGTLVTFWLRFANLFGKRLLMVRS